MKTHDFVVVGAGIAGISIAELLQRSGKRVLLLELEDRLSAAASAQQQGWFHTGTLYAAFPTKKSFQLLVNNARTLLKYYSGFPGMNFASASSDFTSNCEGWFNDGPVYYFYVSPNEKEITHWKKPFWYLATLMARYRMARLEEADLFNSPNAQTKMRGAHRHLNETKSTVDLNCLFAKEGFSLVRHDRSINAMVMLNDLVKSFLASGGEIRLKSKVVKIEKNRATVFENVNGNSHEYVCQGRHIILTSGRYIGELLTDKDRVAVVKSPLLIVAPALFEVNFSRLSVDRAKIINHFHHKTSEGSYSVIGNAAYYNANQTIDVDSLKSGMIDKANNAFGGAINTGNSRMYFGYKAEILRKWQLRNYSYHFIQKDCLALALPGKFSLAFSLAVDCCRFYGIDPSVQIPSLDREQPYPISRPAHAIAASNIYKGIEWHGHGEARGCQKMAE